MGRAATRDGFDGILVDAPCTSTGTIRRHPDVAWLKQEADIGALAALQKRLLQKAVALLKPGGTLVYCTCSLEPEEGEQAIAALLAAEPRMRRAADRAGEVAGLGEIVTADGDLRTLPCHLPHRRPPAAPGSTAFTPPGWLNPESLHAADRWRSSTPVCDRFRLKFASFVKLTAVPRWCPCAAFPDLNQAFSRLIRQPKILLSE